MYKIALRKLAYSRELSSLLCVPLGGGMRVRWEGGSRERIHVYLELTCLVVQQKITHFKAI